ncbi:acetylxylan esterase [Luteipulveratus halotolerans]|uniref:Acetyl xylan esterase n=1 Tax=Luteipulveratus halotolerans TaxID=1631356 RepID=A0A0L6CK61_9MICO|nr:acetylxylan esterase [Luteipulveratus halotolerans]KNX38167.1 acetyl xylan esterase [Luteipulveratus halotolerans]
MPHYDLPLHELEQYAPPRREPDDFAEFWSSTLAEARTHDLDVRSERAAAYLPHVVVHDVTFAGFGGDPIRAWHLRPSGVEGVLPTVVQFLGYGDGRGTPVDWLMWPAAGFAVLVVDTRGQGARARRAGATGDPAGSASPHVEGFLTKGVLDPHDYYYRRVLTDGVRALEAVRTLPGTDPSHVAAVGMSQGGAIALGVSGLAPSLVDATVTHVPFLCDVRREVTITGSKPYSELVAFLRTHRASAEQALSTIDYVDGTTLAAHATAPARFSVALMDEICPPSGVFAAYHHYAGPKTLDVYPYNDHEGGAADAEIASVQWLQELWS